MLLYLVVKNHSFVDGNKRIAATLFLWFMQNNGILYRPDGSKRISDASLVALTLMIAESHTDEMDTMVKVVVSLTGKTKTFLETRGTSPAKLVGKITANCRKVVRKITMSI